MWSGAAVAETASKLLCVTRVEGLIHKDGVDVDEENITSIIFNRQKHIITFSYSQIHDMLAYGVELSWYRAMCTSCEESKQTCFLEDNRIQCRRFCYESTPLSERDFGCKLEYYTPYLLLAAVVIGGLIGL
ncbi:UNVERIFIED_CONTAM: hypothetical protein Scaly_2932100, partial [Sesamum calycinum]